MNFHHYPHLYACFAETYTRHRKGRVEVVRKGNNNRVKVVGRKGNVRVAARGSIPINGGEAMGKLVVGAKRDRRNIREKFLVDPRRGGVLVKGQGNIGNIQVRGGGFIGWQPGRYRRDST